MEYLLKIFGYDLTKFNHFEIVTNHSFGIYVTIIIFVIAGITCFLGWTSSSPLQNKRDRLFLFTLRTSSILLFLSILFQPSIELKKVTKVMNKLAILIDTSLSMSIKNKNSIDRLSKVREYFIKISPEIEKLKDKIEIKFFKFSDKLEEINFSSFIKGEIKADGIKTDIKGSLDKLLELYYNEPLLKGIYIFSDGSDNVDLKYKLEKFSNDTSYLREYLIKGKKIPISTFIPEEPSQIKDLSIFKIIHDDFGFIKNSLEIEVEILAFGFENISIPLTLKRDNKILLTKEIKVEKGKELYKVKLNFIPEEIGKSIYTISTPIYEGESVTINNQKSIVINIIRDKIRTLHICGKPSWDERFLRGFLKKKPDVDLISFFILRSIADFTNSSTEELSLIPFPKEELFSKEINSFDLVIFQNFDYRPYGITQTELKNIADFVKKHKGGFLIIGGDILFANNGYSKTPLEEILPIEIDYSYEGEDNEPFHLELTEAGKNHPITQIETNLEKNIEEWQKLPKLIGYNKAIKAKKGSITLCTHDSVKNIYGKIPIISILEVGNGRSMAILTDTLWFWNLPYALQSGTNRTYFKFFENALRWLIQDPELKQIKVSTNLVNYTLREKVDIIGKVFDKEYKPISGINTLLKIVTPSQTNNLELNLITNDAGEIYFNYNPSEKGFYNVTLSAKKENIISDEDKTIFSVEENIEEFNDTTINTNLLSIISNGTYGTNYSIDNLTKFPINKELLKVIKTQVTDKKSITLWDSPFTYFLLILLLSMEWFFRKRFGLS